MRPGWRLDAQGASKVTFKALLFAFPRGGWAQFRPSRRASRRGTKLSNKHALRWEPPCAQTRTLDWRDNWDNESP